MTVRKTHKRYYRAGIYRPANHARRQNERVVSLGTFQTFLTSLRRFRSLNRDDADVCEYLFAQLENYASLPKIDLVVAQDLFLAAKLFVTTMPI